MADKDNDGFVAKPGEDPYELEWPDDGKEQRAAERAKAAQKAMVRPAPRLLTALVIGLGMVLMFILPIAMVMGNLSFLVLLAAPIVLIGTFLGFPIWVMLERVSRSWRTGLSELAFLVVGIAVGAGWTHATLAIFETRLFDDPAQAQFFRSLAGIFMATAVASAFMAAKFWTNNARMFPKAVYGTLLVIVLLTGLSGYALIFAPELLVTATE